MQVQPVRPCVVPAIREGTEVVGETAEATMASVQDAVNLAYEDPAIRTIAVRPKRPRTVPCPVCKRKFNSADAMKWHRKAKEH